MEDWKKVKKVKNDFLQSWSLDRLKTLGGGSSHKHTVYSLPIFGDAKAITSKEKRCRIQK